MKQALYGFQIENWQHEAGAAVSLSCARYEFSCPVQHRIRCTLVLGNASVPDAFLAHDCSCAECVCVCVVVTIPSDKKVYLCAVGVQVRVQVCACDVCASVLHCVRACMCMRVCAHTHRKCAPLRGIAHARHVLVGTEETHPAVHAFVRLHALEQLKWSGTLVHVLCVRTRVQRWVFR